jgi:hypothetical protein
MTAVTARARADRSPLEVEFDGQVREFLTRIAAQERLALDARSEHAFAWPAWSMDTGLSPAQETFVEHWSPRRVLDASRSMRQVVRVLQHWSRTHHGDDELDEALTVLATLLRTDLSRSRLRQRTPLPDCEGSGAVSGADEGALLAGGDPVGEDVEVEPVHAGGEQPGGEQI